MRLIAFVVSLVCLAAAVFAGQGLWQALTAPAPEAPGIRTAAVADAQPDITPGPPPVPRDWPALFGTRVIPEPQPPAEPRSPCCETALALR